LKSDDVFLGIAGSLAADVADAVDSMNRSSGAESIHQLRLSIARLRAVLAAFSGILPRRKVRHLRRELKWLRLCLAPAREWDVFLAEPTLQGHRAQHGTIVTASAAHRLSALDQIALAMGSRRCASLLRDLYALQEQAATATALPAMKQNERVRLHRAAAEILDKLLKKARKRGRHLDELSVPELHRLRIDLKHLRYVGESLQAWFRQAGARPYIEALRDLQDTLGTIQDGAVARRLVERLKDQFGEPVHGAAGSIHQRHHLHLKQQRRRLRHQWDAFTRLRPFWSKGNN
jgi:CHAD domain-containing protein